MGRKPALSIQQIQEVNKLYDSGWTLKQLSEIFFLCPEALDKYIWNPRPKGRRTK